jgi:N-sulfoglucosamine sulfohydrolase
MAAIKIDSFPLIACGLLAMVLGLLPARGGAGEQPNILFILADDVNYEALGCYGGENATTPNIDRLASVGIKFERAYAAMAMCAPFRGELYTGLYPVRSGVDRNHTKAKEGTKSVCHYLGDLGYRVALTGKKHASPASVFPFVTPGSGTGGDIQWEDVGAFMKEESEAPFCLFVCSHNAHAAWTEGDASQFKAEEIKLLPTQHDNAETREVMTHYYAEVEALDDEVGRALDLLEASGQADKTLVFFCSEQGWALGFSKWTNWDTGVHTGLLARWPGVIKPGVVTDALVQMADVLPTLVDAGGGRSGDKGFDGSSFLPVLRGEAATHREYVYGMHQNVPEGEPYPIRSIRDEEYHLILNLTPEAEYHEKHIMAENSRLVWWPALVAASNAGDEGGKKLMEKFVNRPAVELYRVNQDPYEMKNLADHPEHGAARKRLEAEIGRWMKAQGDPGAILDGGGAKAERKGGKKGAKKED